MVQATHKSFTLTMAPLVFVLLWATGFVVSKLSAGHVAPVWFLSLRFLLALVFLLGFALWQKAAGLAQFRFQCLALYQLHSEQFTRQNLLLASH